MPFTQFIKFLVLIWCLFSPELYADATEDRRVMISASIFPRIIAVDEDLSKKLDSKGNVHLALVYKSDISKAEKIAKQIRRKVKKIAGTKFHVTIVKLKDINQDNSERFSGILLVNPLSNTGLKTVKNYSNTQHILLFSPFEGDVERGVMAGIFVGSKIRPYFNLKSLGSAEVSLKSAIMKVSKTHE